MRLRSIDYLRSTALLALVFLHSSISYLSGSPAPYYSKFTETILYGLLFLFGGSFIITSGIVNTVSAISRLGVAPQFEKRVKGISRGLAGGGALLLMLHFIYIACAGPFSLTPDDGGKNLSLLVSLIRYGTVEGFDPRRLVEGSIISTIGLNLIVMSLLWRALFSRRIVIERKLQYPVLLLLALVIFAFAAFNPSSYRAAQELFSEGEYGLALFLGFFLGKPFPLYPYTSFAILGMLIGFLLFEKHPGRLMIALYVAGLAMLAAGILNFLMDPPGRDAIITNWKTRILIEAGFFVTASTSGLLFIDLRKNPFKRPTGEGSRVSRVFRSFGMVSLTVLLFEAPAAELTRRLWTRIDPGWNSSFRLTLEAAAANTALWCILLALWKTLEYRGSFDHLWSFIIRLVRKKSERFKPEIFDKTGKIPL